MKEDVNFMGIVVKNNLAERIYKISQELNIPRTTVESVVKAYIEDMVESAEKGEDIIVPRVFSIRMMISPKEDRVIPCGRISNVLKERLRNVHIADLPLKDRSILEQVRGDEIDAGEEIEENEG